MFGQETGIGGPDGKERRSGADRRSGEERRADAPDAPAIPVTAERRSGVDRRHHDERRTGESVTADQISLGRRLRQLGRCSR